MFKVPKKTSVYKTEPHPKKHLSEMFFAPELIKFIKDKRKFRTYRYGDKYSYLKPGMEINIKENDNNSFSLKATITNFQKTTFKNLPPQSELAHESYGDKEQQRKVFNGYYAFLGREIRDDDPFLIIDFELL